MIRMFAIAMVLLGIPYPLASAQELLKVASGENSKDSEVWLKLNSELTYENREKTIDITKYILNIKEKILEKIEETKNYSQKSYSLLNYHLDKPPTGFWCYEWSDGYGNLPGRWEGCFSEENGTGIGYIYRMTGYKVDLNNYIAGYFLNNRPVASYFNLNESNNIGTHVLFVDYNRLDIIKHQEYTDVIEINSRNIKAENREIPNFFARLDLVNLWMSYEKQDKKETIDFFRITNNEKIYHLDIINDRIEVYHNGKYFELSKEYLNKEYEGFSILSNAGEKCEKIGIKKGSDKWKNCVLEILK